MDTLSQAPNTHASHSLAENDAFKVMSEGNIASARLEDLRRQSLYKPPVHSLNQGSPSLRASSSMLSASSFPPETNGQWRMGSSWKVTKQSSFSHQITFSAVPEQKVHHHKGHSVAEATIIFWPTMSNDITGEFISCAEVQKHQISSTTVTSPAPSRSRPLMVYRGCRHFQLAQQTLPSACGLIFQMVWNLPSPRHDFTCCDHIMKGILHSPMHTTHPHLWQCYIAHRSRFQGLCKQLDVIHVSSIPESHQSNGIMDG